MILRDKDKIRLVKIIEQTFKTPVKVLAYGSRVNGMAHDCSDLDIAIISKEKKRLNIDEFIEFKEKLRDSNIPILIQAMDWYRIPEYFKENILSNYIKLYENKKELTL